MDSFPGLPQREAEKETGEPVTFADIHTHLLFGVDDGAKDEDEMLAILDAAYQSGTRLLCCTPHFHPGYWGHNRERSAAAYDRLTAAARNRYPDLRLHLGNELALQPGSASPGCGRVTAAPWARPAAFWWIFHPTHRPGSSKAAWEA